MPLRRIVAVPTYQREHERVRDHEELGQPLTAPRKAFGDGDMNGEGDRTKQNNREGTASLPQPSAYAFTNRCLANLRATAKVEGGGSEGGGGGEVDDGARGRPAGRLAARARRGGQRGGGGA